MGDKSVFLAFPQLEILARGHSLEVADAVGIEACLGGVGPGPRHVRTGVGVTAACNCATCALRHQAAWSLHGRMVEEEDGTEGNGH